MPKPDKALLGDAAYLTRKQVAAYLGGISQLTLAAMIKSGELPEYKFGPLLNRYRISDVEALAERRKHRGRSA